MVKVSLPKVLLACDFETTVYEGQTETEVWSAAQARLYNDSIQVFHSIGEWLDNLFSYGCKVCAWFHNLRFDGTFIVDYLLKHGWEWTNEKHMTHKQFSTLISGKNRWYSMKLKFGNTTVEIRDSVKLVPLTLAQAGEAFNTPHRKLSMEYKGRRYAGCPISKEEMGYIVNDVLVLKEVLEYMLDAGHKKLTIGSNAMYEYQIMMGKGDYMRFFPDVSKIELEDSYGSSNAESYIRKSYRGGFCYLKPDRVGRVGKGRTYDVNSLYPSVMHSKSGNPYPIGRPHFWRGDIPLAATKEGRVFIIRFSCRFELKAGHLPTVQIKGDICYNPKEWLVTSDIVKRGKRYKEWLSKDGTVRAAKPILTLTSSDYYMFIDHYNVSEMEVFDGAWFYSAVGLFDGYIDHFMTKKMNAKSKGERMEAKLFLNNLYGKFASSDDSSYRIPRIGSYGNVELGYVEEHEKEVAYIPVGTFVTAYARRFTIEHAQLNYAHFIYADTDSIHMDDVEAVGIDEDDNALLCWKHESDWSSGVFIRQKTYAEFIRKEGGKKVYPRWKITCAGMPEKCKSAFLATHPITDFKVGLSVRGKLVPVRIPGGVVLKETTFTLR